MAESSSQSESLDTLSLKRGGKDPEDDTESKASHPSTGYHQLPFRRAAAYTGAKDWSAGGGGL